jgi:phospholipase A1
MSANRFVPVLAALFALAPAATPQDESIHASFQPPTRESRFKPYRTNYFLFASFNPDLEDRRFAGDSTEFPDGENENVEVKFQLSFRYLVKDKGELPELYIAYTGTNYWQVYDWEHSAPFRTTDHTPEIFFEWMSRDAPFAFRASPLLHQSNGESGELSRSWNRAYGEVLWSSDRALLAPRSFAYDMPHSEAAAALRVWTVYDIDDLSQNEDITDFLGNFELRGELFPDWRGDHRLWGVLRDNLDFGGDRRTTTELNWSFALPQLGPGLRVMLQWFYGYGESLLDYNVHSRRFSVGFELRG